MTESTPRTGLVLLSVTGVLWGSISIAVRLLQNAHMPTASIAFWRFACACLVLFPVLRGNGLRELVDQLRSPGRLCAVSFGSLTFQLLFFVAVADVGASISTLIALGLAPVALATFRTMTGRTLPPPSTLVIMGMALAGLILVTAAGAHTSAGQHPVRGMCEAAASGLCYAASTAASSTLSTRLSAASITFSASLCGVIVLAPVLVLRGWHVPDDTSHWAGILWLGVITTVLAYGLFYAGLRTVPGHIAMIVTLLEPATAVVLASLVLGETLTLVDVTGAVLLLTSVAALFLRARPREQPAPL